MTPQIKQRIEQINNGQVPEGYKKTEFGVFPCDWVTDKTFGDIALLSNKKYDPSADNNNPKCIELEHINSFSGYTNGHTFGKLQNSIKNTFSKNDILFGKLRPYLGKYYHAKEAGVCSTEIWVIKNKDSICNDYLYRIVSSKKFIDDSNDSSFGTKMPRASWDYLKKVKYAYPSSKSEQEKIAEILMKWDEAIEFYNLQIKKLEQYKQICLKKMFPSKGQKVPEWRFKGFPDAWEQRKLGEIADIMGGNAWKSTDYSDDGEYLVITIANVSGELKINDKVGNRISCNNPGEYLLSENDILVSLTGNVGRVSKMTDIKGLLNQRVGKIASNCNDVHDNFLFHLLRNPTFERVMIDAGQGAAQKNISNSDVLNYSVFLPTNIDEQKQIGAFLDNLDNLITLHQRKVEAIRKQRTTLQQYLLNGIVRV